MAEVKWIKITTDMFDNQKIKYLRKLPDGNNIVLIWVMLLTMAGRCNSSGMIFLTENIPYTPKMLADELGFEENTVLLALQALEQLNMIVTDNGYFTIAGWSEYQNIDGMERLKEQNRKRVARYRQKQKMLESNVVKTDCNVTGNVTSNACNDIDKDIDKDIEIENKRKKERKKKETSYDEILSVVENDELKELYYEYIKMRKFIKAPMTDRALKMLISKVNDLEPTDINRQKQMLEIAIIKNWKSVYKLKDDNNKTTNHSTNNQKDDWKGYCKPPEDDPLPF